MPKEKEHTIVLSLVVRTDGNEDTDTIAEAVAETLAWLGKEGPLAATENGTEIAVASAKPTRDGFCPRCGFWSLPPEKGACRECGWEGEEEDE